jgi:hypothetical protein
MAIAQDQSTVFSFIHFASYTGQSSGSFGSNDLTSALLNQIPTTKDGELNSTVNITFGFNTYYKMQGWNPITQRYEDWHSMGTPQLIPPSGHTLQNIGIIGTWTDR